VSGVADVAFIGDRLYGLLAGAGCSHGLAGTDNSIFRVNPDGTTTTIANLSAFLKANPVVNPDHDDFEPDGTWYSMIVVRDAFYAAEPNHQEVDRITPQGQITRIADLSTLFVPPAGWQGPTSLAYHGNFYFGTLGTFPVQPGTEGIYKLTPSGQVKVKAPGLTAVLGLAFDSRDRIYVLEMSTAPNGPVPFTGDVVRIEPDGTRESLASALAFPTGMTLGPDGSIYVSDFGFGFPPGAGQVVKITLPED
jgi:hypothetical protein